LIISLFYDTVSTVKIIKRSVLYALGIMSEKALLTGHNRTALDITFRQLNAVLILTSLTIKMSL